MVPALQVHFWLVMQHKFLPVQCLTQARFNRLPLDRPSIHVLLKELEIVAPIFLGVVHRGVRALDQGLRILTIIGVNADADTHADMNITPINVVRRRQSCKHFLR